MQQPNITRTFTKTLEDRVYRWPKLLQVVLGPRQVGKTTGVKQIFERWSGPKHFATADTPLPPTSDWIVQQWNRARSFRSESLLVIDEIQKVDRWSEVVKSLFDEDRDAGKIRIILLGSASLKLQRESSDSLAGRYEIIPAPHWSFNECRESFNWSLEQFLKFGGYPGAAPLIEEPNRWQDFIINSVVEPVIHRDIPTLQEIRKPALFRQVFELALHYPAQVLSFQKLLGQLQESGNASTIKHYLETLSQAFLLKTLEKYSTRPLTTKTSSPKIIPLCPALMGAITDPLRVDRESEWRGRVLEACVGAQLLRSRGRLYYWREGKYEVDFVLEREKWLYAFEVKSNARKQRGGLHAFSQKFRGAIGMMIDEETATQLLLAPEIDTFLDTM